MTNEQIKQALHHLNKARGLAGSIVVMIGQDGSTEVHGTVTKAEAARVLGDCGVQLDENLKVLVSG